MDENRVAAQPQGGNGQNVEQQLAVLSELVSRLDFAREHGLSYGGDRDLYKVGGYPKTLKFQHFEQLYDRDPIAAQIVDMPAETTWRSRADVVEEGQEDGTDFTEAWTELADRLGVWGWFEEADRRGRLGRYSVLLIGVAGGDDRALEQPLPRLNGPEDVLYLSVFDESQAPVKTWVTEPRDERFGRPETYEVDLSGDVGDFTAAEAIVHHSRVIHVTEGLKVYGREALRRVYNDLMDLQKVATSTAEAFWQRVAGILQAVIDKDATIDDEQLKELDENLAELYHELRKTFYGKGVELSRLAESEPNPEKAADLYMTRIAAGAAIPKRMLFGSETGERSSTEDQKTYLGSIKERQTQHAEPNILRRFIDRIVEAGALPRHGRDGYTVVWPTLFEVPDAEVAEANKSRADAAKALTALGGDPMMLVEVDADRNVWLRPTGERGELTPEELEPEPEPEEPMFEDEEGGEGDEEAEEAA